MKILISNDDGVYAPGIKALYEELSKEHDVFVVAPLEERSTTGHTLSLDNPLRVVSIDSDRNIYGCSGFPADCVLMGFAQLMDGKPDLVISGINRGANLGQDIYYSGTMAAAREAVFHGIPSMAVSLVCDFIKGSDHEFHFDTAAKFMAKLLKHDVRGILSPLHVLNVNVPDLKSPKGVVMTELGLRCYSEEITRRKDFRGRDYFWVGGVYQGFEGGPQSDCQVVQDEKISLTLLNLLGKDSEQLNEWQSLASLLEK